MSLWAYTSLGCSSACHHRGCNACRQGCRRECSRECTHQAHSHSIQGCSRECRHRACIHQACCHQACIPRWLHLSTREGCCHRVGRRRCGLISPIIRGRRTRPQPRPCSPTPSWSCAKGRPRTQQTRRRHHRSPAPCTPASAPTLTIPPPSPTALAVPPRFLPSPSKLPVTPSHPTLGRRRWPTASPSSPTTGTLPWERTRSGALWAIGWGCSPSGQRQPSQCQHVCTAHPRPSPPLPRRCRSLRHFSPPPGASH
mgnify:CR=1 FL=1